jgi:dihydropteroate synthase
VGFSADLVIPARGTGELSEIASWDGARTATFAASEFPVDVVRFEGSSSPPVVLSRAKRAESLKALPGSLRTRAQEAFDRAARRSEELALGHGRSLDLARPPAVMGILNVTPDSFSDGGLYLDAGRAVERALRMFEDGAAIVDVGGESTRPASYGEAAEVSAEEELRRVIPVLEGIRVKSDLPLSIDTRKAAVAREALAAGADLVNDVTALRYDPEMADTIARAKAAALLMHMKGTDARLMQFDVQYAHPLADIASDLARALSRALDAGIPPNRLAVDPGLGFGKSPEGNLLLLRHLAAFRSLGFPVAAGASRKAFVRRFSGVADTASSAERLPGSLACIAAAARSGASLVRVHDVAESVRFVKMLAAVETPATRPARPAAATAAP